MDHALWLGVTLCAGLAWGVVGLKPLAVFATGVCVLLVEGTT